MTGLAALQVLAAQDGADAGDQQPLGEGLGDIIVGAHGEAQRLVQLVVLGSQEDDRHGADRPAHLAHPAQQLHAVHLRHLDVEDGEVRRIVGKGLQRRRAVRIDARDEALRLERDRDGREDVAVVVDERDHLAHSHSWLAAPVA